jgi:hypothetical protein
MFVILYNIVQLIRKKERVRKKRDGQKKERNKKAKQKRNKKETKNKREKKAGMIHTSFHDLMIDINKITKRTSKRCCVITTQQNTAFMRTQHQ